MGLEKSPFYLLNSVPKIYGTRPWRTQAIKPVVSEDPDGY